MIKTCMKILKKMNKGFLIIAFILLSKIIFSQNQLQVEKIDPVFVSLIAQQKKTDSLAQKKSRGCKQKKPAGAKNSKDFGMKKIYECIVYTRDPKALRDRNITINSVLPTFVTARATLQQIQQMSLMPGVTFIGAPEINFLH